MQGFARLQDHNAKPTKEHNLPIALKESASQTQENAKIRRSTTMEEESSQKPALI